ncbi:MAG: hypothetical protein ACM3XM_16325 [Mycobacterium leprae]
MGDAHTPEDVIRHAREGRLEEWVHTFLTHAGNNRPMSDGLRLQERFWIGPLQLPLERMERCCGPEPGMEYRMNPDSWEERVGAMVRSMAEGWTPPPLIAQFGADRRLSVRDGNHRHEAVRRAGLSSYWCVIWCDSAALCREAEALLKEYGA